MFELRWILISCICGLMVMTLYGVLKKRLVKRRVLIKQPRLLMKHVL